MNDHLQLLTVRQVAAELNISRWQTYRLIHAGEIHTVMWGLGEKKRTYVVRHELDRYRKTIARPVRRVAG